MKTIEQISGRMLPYRGDDVDTDRILPARYMKSVTFSGLELHAFEDERRAFARDNRLHAFDNPAYKGATVVVVNSNFGCGSSREHAARALMRSGIRAIVGESFGEIFAGNCRAIGVPVLRLKAEQIKILQALGEKEADTQINVDLREQVVLAGEHRMSFEMDAGIRQLFLEGRFDSVHEMLAAKTQIVRTAEALPYAGWAK